jgi:hypothetical protein
MVGPFERSGSQVSEQERHAGLDLVCNVFERREGRRVGATCFGGIGDAPVRARPRRVPAQITAGRANVVPGDLNLLELTPEEALTEDVKGEPVCEPPPWATIGPALPIAILWSNSA